MRKQEYPPQEPLAEAGEAYSAECFRRSEGILWEEHFYGPDPYQGLLVFRPTAPNGRVLIFWHGGGWRSGYKEWMGFMAPAFTDAGVIFVSPSYRLAPKHKFPVGIEDCADAVAWVAKHLSAPNRELLRIFLGGHSAGGHCAALLAVTRHWQQPRTLPSAVVKGFLPISGVYEFGENSGLLTRPVFLDHPSDERNASPLAQIVSPLPNFLIAYGTDDYPHFIIQAQRFGAALRAAGGIAHEVAMEARNHYAASYAGGEVDGPWVKRALAFMDD